jgi:hypothetical protein
LAGSHIHNLDTHSHTPTAPSFAPNQNSQKNKSSTSASSRSAAQAAQAGRSDRFARA